jgi:hypothetical protein
MKRGDTRIDHAGLWGPAGIVWPVRAATFATMVAFLATASCSVLKPASTTVLLPLHVCGEGLPAKDARDQEQQRESARLAALILALRELTEVYDRDQLAHRGRLADVARANDWKVARNLREVGSEEIESRSSGDFGNFTVRSSTEVSGAALIADEVTMEFGQQRITVNSASLASASDARYLSKVLGLVSEAGLSGEFTDQDSGVSKFCLSCSVPASDQWVAVAAAADALIIDCTGTAFRPALINRIVTENGNSVFEPSEISPEVLAKTGAGEYAKDIEQAKTLLAARGAKHPLVVKATGVQRSTDAQLSEADATTVLWANQKNRFLEDAKVVFVCGK